MHMNRIIGFALLTGMLAAQLLEAQQATAPKGQTQSNAPSAPTQKTPPAPPAATPPAAPAATPAKPPAASPKPVVKPPTEAAKPLVNAVKQSVARISPRVDEVIQLVKEGISESMILRKLQITNKPYDPSPVEMKAMKAAGVSDRVVEAMMSPSLATANTLPNSTPTATNAPQLGGNSANGAAAGANANSTVGVSVSISGATNAADAFNSDLDGLGCVQEPRKRSVAITEFDYGAIRTAIQATFGTNLEIGKGIMALLQKRLQTDGNYRIVERSKQGMEALQAELNKGQSTGVKQGTNPKIGKFVGADAFLMGTIVTFGNDDKKKQVGGFGGKGSIWSGIKVGSTSNKAVVAISARLVDTETGELIDTMEARGESERKGKSVDLGGIFGNAGGGGGFDMTSSNFAETIVGEATIKCIDDLAKKMIAQRAKVKMRRVEAEGRIAQVTAKNLYLNIGDNDGVKKCDRFEVSRIVQEVKDPVTNETIDLLLEKVGEMVVTEIRPAMAIGVFNGSAPPQKNMAVRKLMAPEAASPAPEATAPAAPAAAPVPAPAATTPATPPAKK